MKVGIITLTSGGLNYGNTLQNFALQIFLKKIGIYSETILDSRNNFHRKITLFDYFRHLSLKKKVSLIINYNKSRDVLFDLIERQEKYIQFDRRHIIFENTLLENGIPKSNINDYYDFFIVGSDQVWNPYSGINNLYFLKFAEKNKRISYAASFGIKNIPKQLRSSYEVWLRDMKHISVREHAGAEIIKDLIGKDVPVLVDPTLLLNKSDWSIIAKKPKGFNEEKYILTYFLGAKTKAITNIINDIAKTHNLNIINLLDRSFMEWYLIGPDEFIYLIEQCSLMYTDSFHGTVFSILMGVPFVVCERVSDGEQSMNSRIDTLLDMFNLQSRRGTPRNNYVIEDPFSIDYSNVEKILTGERLHSEEYIKRALNID